MHFHRRTTCIQNGNRGSAVTPGSLYAAVLKEKTTKLIPLKKTLAVCMAHDQSRIQAPSMFHLQEKTKRAKTHTTNHGKLV